MGFNTGLILKNTILLYIRLFIVILLSFYTSRVLLQALGVTDFGVYSVVGGIAAMFASLKGAFSSASQRFYNYEIGQSNSDENITRIFNTSILIHLLIAVILLLLLECVGLYMVNNVLSIPSDRLAAANVILQISIGSTFISTLAIPFDAMIMARERMNFYALVSVVDSVLKLMFVFGLNYSNGDRLVLYGLIMFGISLLNFLLSSVYCMKEFRQCRIRFNYDRDEVRKIAEFGGWNFLGNLGFSLCHEAANFILNIFGGVIANAARGVVYQLRNAIMLFLSNALVAVRPQATQEFASNNKYGFYRVIFYSTKLVYFIALCMAIPLFIYAYDVFELWLGQVPEYAVIFMRVSLIHMMIRSFHEPIDLIFKSAGKLKVYQLTSLSCQALILPITFTMLKLGFPIYYVFINMCIAELVEYILIVNLARKHGLDCMEYYINAIKPIILTTLIVVSLSVLISLVLKLNFILEVLIIIVQIVICIFVLGLTTEERHKILSNIIKR